MLWHSATSPKPGPILSNLGAPLLGVLMAPPANKARYRSICPSGLAWLGVNLKSGYDDTLSSFKKCYRTRLGNLGHPAVGEDALLLDVSAALDVEVKAEWRITKIDWVEFFESDLKKGGESIHSITRLAKAPPVGEVVLDGVKRSDDHAMLQSERIKWSKI